MKKLHLILTIDYEVFGNGSGCVDKCVIEPAERMMRVAESIGAPLTFFVDTLEFQAMSTAKEFRESAVRVSEQISVAIGRGHDAQLHLHPQWKNARLDENGNWALDLSLWRIGDLAKNDVRKMLREGKTWLETLCRPTSSDYRCLAFRAGGWCIQPSDFVVRELIDLGFKIDSTVAPGFHNSAKGEWRDFRNVPSLPYWHVLDNVCLYADGNSELVEIPIATGNIGLKRHLKTLLPSSASLAPGCKGSYIGPDGRSGRIRGKLSKLMHLGQAMLDFSTMPADILIRLTKQWNEKHRNFLSPIPIVAIAHTKNFTPASEVALKEYLLWGRGEGIIFSTFKQWLDVHNDKHAS